MRKIRTSVFETNSSSVHSISISSKEISTHSRYQKEKLGDLRVDKKTNKVPCRFGNYGWEIAMYTTQQSKLSYLLTMVAETEGRYLEDTNAFFELPGYRMLNDLVAERCRCDGLDVKSEIGMEEFVYNGESEKQLYIDGGIDHQSCEDYDSLADFLEANDVTAEEFIFADGVVLHTGNDNY